VPSFRPIVQARPTLLLLAMLGACAEGSATSSFDAQIGDLPRGADAGLTATRSPGEPGGEAQASTPPSPADLPAPLACSDRAPASFSAQCAGCHNLASSDKRYPNLFAFQGSEAQLIERVRSGGKGMPAFAGAMISDASLHEVFVFLQSRGSGARPLLTLGSAMPLFANAEAVVPVTFVRDDGALITRAAGRVRGRHELEGTYGPFGPMYFEDRTYGFVIEDFTARGESRIRVTYLPIARPQDKTNFRAFKIYGDGNVFHANTGMDSDTALPSLLRAGNDPAANYTKVIAPYARVQSHEVTRNARANRALQKDDLFEFEFGVFIDPGDVSANSRTAYYTDTFRYRIGRGGLTPENFDTSGTLGPTEIAYQGGATTLAWVYAEPDGYFSQMALNIQHEHVQRFVEGRRLFHTDFASGAHSESGNPALPEQANKAGPLFVTTSCERCHAGNGGGRTLTAALDEQSSLVFKLYGADASLGGQLQLQEGSARLLDSEQHSVTLADATAVTLSRPHFEVRPKAGAVPMYSARIARRLVGLGLLEAIDEQTILSQADPEDCDANGISGRPHFVSDPAGRGVRLGRFGWRAEKVSVEHQVADALAADLGVQTRLIPGAKGEIELNDADLDRMSTYMRLLGVPPQRTAEDPLVAKGEALFRSVGCAYCHVPAVTTGEAHPYVELRGQQIRPYTDLLLHDLGPDLADDAAASRDGTGNEPATASEWRTAPLWGVGLSQQVQGYVALLHDGRAQSVLEAVLWHGGEATRVRERVTQLSREDREALIRFVESL
jgi:CxxC motif-containing protein (DUF1111 family)/cytochrome c553